MLALSAFGVTALPLAALGLYGIIAYKVAERWWCGFEQMAEGER